MHRRRWLTLGLGSAALLAIGGGGLAMLQPGLVDGRLSHAGQRVFRPVAAALLEGSLPEPAAARAAALAALMQRIDAVTASLAPHAQSELSRLLALLASEAGRRTFAGLQPGWEQATVTEVQSALQSMRISRISLRQQAYHALHDLTGGAYFADPSTWQMLGYPGPIRL